MECADRLAGVTGGGAVIDDVSVGSLVSGGGVFFNNAGPNDTNYDCEMNGTVVGGTLGYSYHTGHFVLGVEGELGVASISGNELQPYGVANLGGDTISSTSIDDLHAMITGRLGFASGQTLYYAKGGWACCRPAVPATTGPMSSVAAPSTHSTTNGRSWANT